MGRAERVDILFEKSAAVLVIFKLVETCAGRRQQYDVSLAGVCKRERHCAVQSAGLLDWEGRGLARGRGKLRGDFFGGGADQQNFARPAAQWLREGRVVAAFVLTSHDYEQAAGKCCDGLQGGVDVGGLGVVEKFDAGDFGDEFEPVFDAREAAYARGNGGRLGAGKKSGAGRRQNIFEIVLAAQGDVGALEQEGRLTITAENKVVAVQASSGGDALQAAEPIYPRALGSILVRRGVVSIEQGGIAFQLIFEDARLGAAVGCERGVAIEVIGGEIEEHRDVGTKFIDGFELEAAHLRYRDAGGSGFGDAGDQRSSDIAGDDGGRSRGGENIADQRSDRGFAVRAGDGDQPAAQKPPGQFDFAPNGDVRGARRSEAGMGGRHSGAGYDQVLFQKRGGGVAAQFQGAACGAQRAERLAS